MTEHSDFSRAQGVVSKHVNVMSALSEAVAGRHLMDVSTVRGGRCSRQHWMGWLACFAQHPSSTADLSHTF